MENTIRTERKKSKKEGSQRFKIVGNPCDMESGKKTNRGQCGLGGVIKLELEADVQGGRGKAMYWHKYGGGK